MNDSCKIYPSRRPAKRHQYYETYYAKQKEKGSVICPLCYGKYMCYNKNHHMKSQHHLRAVEEKKKNEELKSAIQKLDQIFTEEELKYLPPTSEAGSVAGD